MQITIKLPQNLIQNNSRAAARGNPQQLLSALPAHQQPESKQRCRNHRNIEYFSFFKKILQYKKKHSSAKKRTECRQMPHSQQEPELKLYENINFDPKKQKFEIARFRLMCYLVKRNHLLK